MTWVLKYLPRASDAALRLMRDFWVDALEKFKDKDSEVCIALFSRKWYGEGDVESADGDRRYARTVAGWDETNNLIAIENVLRSAIQGRSIRMNGEMAEKDLTWIRMKLIPLYGQDLGLLADENQWIKHSDRVCEMLLMLYRETQNIPEERQGNLLRYMASHHPLLEFDEAPAEFDRKVGKILSSSEPQAAINRGSGRN